MNRAENLNQKKHEEVFGKLAHIAQAIASPTRLRILQVLSNRSCTVEALSHFISEPVPNTSQHLQKMKQAGLVDSEKHGVQRVYRVSCPQAVSAFLAIQDVGLETSSELRELEEYFSPADLVSDTPLEVIVKQVKCHKALLVDVRDADEFEEHPIALAVNIPVAKQSDISKAIRTLPKSKTIYVFCRGRYCSMANGFVQTLRQKSFSAYRLKEHIFQILEKIEK